MTAVFRDAYYFVALLNPRDEGHAAALRYTSSFSGRLWTTAWVLTEVASACARPPGRSAFLSPLADIENDPRVYIVAPSDDQYGRGKELFAQRPDKEWSLTDCISFVTMKEHRLTDALTADHHFEQAGFTVLLK